MRNTVIILGLVLGMIFFLQPLFGLQEFVAFVTTKWLPNGCVTLKTTYMLMHRQTVRVAISVMTLHS